MVSSEVQRTLVKSPPELWAELSDPAALARHLGTLGEIRIIRTEAERTVEWEGENVTGSVSIQPSGWGTKVTLKVSRAVLDVAPPLADAAEPEQTADVEHRLEVQPEESQPQTDDPIAPVPEPRRGFFARLFRRRARTEPQPSAEPAPPDAFAAVSEALAPARFAATDAFAVPQAAEPTSAPLAPPAPPPPDDISAELMAAEEVAAEEVTAVLTAVLDRLGAAHHRPFSRA